MTIPHSSACRRPAPVLRQSWRGLPEAWCPSCGRYAPADNTASDWSNTSRGRLPSASTQGVPPGASVAGEDSGRIPAADGPGVAP